MCPAKSTYGHFLGGRPSFSRLTTGEWERYPYQLSLPTEVYVFHFQCKGMKLWTYAQGHANSALRKFSKLLVT